MRELRLTVRSLARTPLFTVAAVLSLALTREIGIRMALGAGAAQLRRLVVREVAAIVAIGLAAGLGAAALAARLIQSVLFDTRPVDPVVYGAAAAVLGGIVLAAACLPVRRATAVDPIIALRYE